MTAKFTILDGDRRFKQIEVGDRLPPCQAHLIDSFEICREPGEFDSPTSNHGPWADLCEKHAERFSPKGCTLGYHRMKSR